MEVEGRTALSCPAGRRFSTAASAARHGSMEEAIAPIAVCFFPKQQPPLATTQRRTWHCLRPLTLTLTHTHTPRTRHVHY